MKIIIEDEDILGMLACQYRRNRDHGSRESIKAQYAEVVDRLIKSGTWNEVPSFEDQLPDEAMPKAFWNYWFSEPDKT